MTGFKTAHELAMADLRDQFACAALTGLLAYSHVNPLRGNPMENATYEQVGVIAYCYADAMLQARKSGGQP